MGETRFYIEVGGRRISALQSTPDEAASACLLYAPGAGSNIDDPFGAHLAQALPPWGLALVRFQFPYMEAGRRRPDSPEVLKETWRAVIQDAASRDSTPLIAGGRSMGGRYASLVVAEGAPVRGLALFAYPLHPPRKPEQRRVEHLPLLAVPTLFCSGTRDTFASSEELSDVARFVPNADFHLLEGADHGFAVLKSSGRRREDVYQEAATALLEWSTRVRV